MHESAIWILYAKVMLDQRGSMDFVAIHFEIA